MHLYKNIQVITTIQIKNLNGAITNTGRSGDIESNIYDMAENYFEWTTEHSQHVNSVDNTVIPCTYRGGSWGTGEVQGRQCSYATETAVNRYVTFRPILYLK